MYTSVHTGTCMLGCLRFQSSQFSRAGTNHGDRETEPEPGDLIYAALAKEQKLAIDLANSGGRRGRGRQQLRAPLSLVELKKYKRGGDAVAETNRLFDKYRERREDPEWQSPDGEKFRKYKQRAAVKTVHKLQTQLIHHITERTAELELLHRRLGQQAARSFLAAIQQRSKALDKLVHDYNEVAPLAGVRKLDATRLRENGLENEEV
jgi:hypothetical protein